MRCVVVGGGLLGAHTALALEAAGHEVTVYTRSVGPVLAAAAPRPGLRIVRGDVADAPALLAELEGADVVFAMAGTSTPALSAQSAMASARGSVLPSLAVLDLSRQAGVRRLVLASSGGTVYGTVSKLPTPEEHPCVPISIHGLNAWCVERYAEFFAAHHGLEAVVLRYSNVYGPGQLAHRGQGVIAAWCRAVLEGERVRLYGDPRSVSRDFVYVRDAAQASVELGLHPDALGPYNVGGSSHTLAEIIEVIGEVAGSPVVAKVEPSRPVDVPVTDLDCSKVRALTGWSATTSLRDGIAASWQWLRDFDADAHLPRHGAATDPQARPKKS